jgi:hypothetical protein
MAWVSALSLVGVGVLTVGVFAFMFWLFERDINKRYEPLHRYYCKEFHERGMDDYPHRCFREKEE